MNWIEAYTNKRATGSKSGHELRLLNAVSDLANMNGRKPPSIPSDYADQLSLFCSTFSLAADSIVASAKLLVLLVDQDENAFEHILAKAPHIKLSTLEWLYRCGKIGLNPLLLTHSPQVARHALRLSEDAAKTALTHGLPVIVEDRGDLKIEFRRLEEISAKDAALAIDNKGMIRSNSELRTAYAGALTKQSTGITNRYDIDDQGNITFHANSTFTPAQLHDISSKAMQIALGRLTSLSTKATA